MAPTLLSELALNPWCGVGAGLIGVAGLVGYSRSRAAWVKTSSLVLGTVGFLVGGFVCAVLTLSGLGALQEPRGPSEEGVAGRNQGTGGTGAAGRAAGDPRARRGGMLPGMQSVGLSRREHLAVLIAKLDRLTRGEMTLTLRDEERTRLRAELEGITTLEDLKEEEAANRFHRLFELLARHRDVLREAGVVWQTAEVLSPGAAGRGVPSGEETTRHLKSLQDSLAGDKKG